MRTHEEMTAIFERARKETGKPIEMGQRVYNPAGLTEYTVEWNSHKEIGHNTQDEVDAACDRICDYIESVLKHAQVVA